jgi:hypothetical protein
MPIVTYVGFFLLCPWFLKCNKAYILNFFLLFFVLFAIFLGNIFVINNYYDLVFKGICKLLFFVLIIPVLYEFFKHGMLHKLEVVRIMVWGLLVASMFIEKGINLQNMQQILLILMVVIVEHVSIFVRKKEFSFLFAVSIILLILTTKKQILFSMVLFLLMYNLKGLKKLLPYFIVGIISVSLGLGVENEKTGVTQKGRMDNLALDRVFNPDPYGNMRLFLVFNVIPKTFEYNPLFGYGLERYGSIEAYKSGRDVERNLLDMGKFIGEEYSNESVFGSVAADVGLVTIFAQMGFLGILFYILLVRSVGKKDYLKTLIVILPFFFGGPVVYSVTFPVLIGIIHAAGFCLSKGNIQNNVNYIGMKS